MLDRIAKNLGALATRKTTLELGKDKNTAPWIKVDDYYWLFHKFVAGKNKDIVNPSLESLREAKNKGLLREPQNSTSAIYAAHVDQNDGAKGRINLGALQALLDMLKENGSDLAEQAIEELNEDVTE